LLTFVIGTLDDCAQIGTIREGATINWGLALAAFGSFVAGLLGGAVGLVLGSLRLPALVAVSTTPAAAAGANIAVSAVSALVAAIAHARAGRVDWRIAAWMAPPSVAAAFAGGYFGGLLPESVLFGGIAAALLWNGVELLLDPRAPPPTRHPRIAAAVAGAFIGILGGAVGLILGTLRLPVLLGSLGLSAHRAVGTNLAIGFLLGLAGFAGHAVRLEVGWLVLVVSLVGALPGAWLGARFAGRLSDTALRRAIGGALLVVGIGFAAEAAV
jgi:uncharacterized membrane protein YfcA